MYIAQQCLEKARYFVELAQETEPQGLIPFQYFLETAIIWAGSVTPLIQKQYSKDKGFTEWYAKYQKELRDDPIANFFEKQRKVILNEGTISLKELTITSLYPTVVAKSLEEARRMVRMGMESEKKSKTEIRYVFDKSSWDEEPALDLLEDHLDRLQIFIQNADSKLGRHT